MRALDTAERERIELERVDARENNLTDEQRRQLELERDLDARERLLIEHERARESRGLELAGRTQGLNTRHVVFGSAATNSSQRSAKIPTSMPVAWPISIR